MAVGEQGVSSQSRKSHDPLLDQPGFAVDRLPMLPVVFDRLAAGLSEGLRSLCRAPATFSVIAITSGSLFDILSASKGAIGAVLHSPELDCRPLAIFDRSLAGSMVQILLGGDATEPTEASERPFTKIEMNLVQRIAELAAKALQTAWAGIAEASFEVERQETLVDTGILGRRDTPVVAARILFQAIGVSGSLTVTIPQTALLPLRQKLSRDPDAESPHGDPRWTRQMQNGVSFAEIPVKGVLEEIPMTLGEVAEMEVGHVLKLRGSGMGRVRLECGDHDLFWCKLSQIDGRYCLEVEEPIVEEGDILGDLLLH
jgi:flagellar motor switch protein FliM